jgi:hypothetical protein
VLDFSSGHPYNDFTSSKRAVPNYQTENIEMKDAFNQNKFTLYLQPTHREKLNLLAAGGSRAEVIKLGIQRLYEEKFGPVKQQNEEAVPV